MIQNFSRYQCFPTVGKIYDKKRKRFVNGYEYHSGYIYVRLQDDDGVWKTMLFHRVILEAYRGEGIPDGLEVNHIDECKNNNQISNLNLMTPKENCNFGTRNERAAKAQMNDPNKSKRVQAFDKEGKLVFDFPSVREARRQLGFDIGNISACCLGKSKSAYGYIWKYLDEGN